MTTAKSFLLSKTFWVQIATVLSLVLPPVRAWLDENPEQFVAVFAAVNVLVRFATSGKVNIFSGTDDSDDKDGSGGLGGLPLWIAMVTLVGIFGLLPACSSTTEYPITGSIYLRDPHSGAKAGLTFAPGEMPAGRLRVPGYDPETGDLLGLADLTVNPHAKVLAEK